MSEHNSLVLVGLMSGTSLDGISAAVVRFTETNSRITADLLSFEQQPYLPEQRKRLAQAMQRVTPREYCRLNVDVGHWCATAAMNALNQSSVARGDVAAVASHGHTLWHEPGHSTLQIGDAATIAERTGCRVISDFRARDVAAGGQGAPLVSMADVTLFADTNGWRALQNLGGIGNVTVVPPSSLSNAFDGVRAFDTGPGVVLMDSVYRYAMGTEDFRAARAVPSTNPTIQPPVGAGIPFNDVTEKPIPAYDVDGRLATLGTPDVEFVKTLLEDPYFSAPPPKSTGRELFNSLYVARFISSCQSRGLSVHDLIATAVAFTADSVADQYRRFIPEPIADVVLSGGGARNPVLVGAIKGALHPLPVRQFDEMFFDGEAKEAVAFALLGYLHLTGRPGNVPRATGARASRQLGVLTPA